MEVSCNGGNRTQQQQPAELRIADKLCGVCGDKALGHNFNAVSCESCKAFFRRNAPKNKEFRCPFTNNCEITPITRRFCQKCRLAKCFSIGMRKDYIMSDEDKAVKREKIEINRAKKRTGHPSGYEVNYSKAHKGDETSEAWGSPGSSPSPANLAPSPASPVSATCEPKFNPVSVITTTSNKDGQTPASPASTSSSSSSSSSVSSPSTSVIPNTQSPSDELSKSQNKVTLNSNSNSNNNDETIEEQPIPKLNPTEQSLPQQSTTSTPTDNVNGLHVQSDSLESILAEAIKLEYQAYSSLTKTHQNSRELNEAERAKITELISANKALDDPLDDDVTSLVGDDCRFKSESLLDVINLTAIAIRRLIKTCKKINAFRNLCQEDQVALLKGGCTEMLILRSAINYDPDKDSWKIPHTQEQLDLKVEVLKEARGNIYEAHQQFLRTFEPRWRADESVMHILGAITLFTPERQRVVHTDVIRLEQNSYYYLLRRYLESVYPGCEGRSTFLRLIQKLAELHRLNEEHLRVYLGVNPRHVEPLLREIFDLKPH